MRHPMLAETATQEHALDLIARPDWWIEQKLDGHRLLAVRHDEGVSFRNRAGDLYSKGVPSTITTALLPLPIGTILDGELVGKTFWVFDVLHVERDLMLWRAFDRRVVVDGLMELLEGQPEQQLLPKPVQAVSWTMQPDAKWELLQRLIDHGAEGVMIKHVDGMYLEGQRSSRMLKFKFTETVDCVVLQIKRNGKDAIALALYDAETGEPYEIGACSMIGKVPVSVGDVVEVRYLYVGANGRLYQPTLLRKRDDKSPEECTNAQLRHVNKDVLS